MIEVVEFDVVERGCGACLAAGDGADGCGGPFGDGASLGRGQVRLGGEDLLQHAVGDFRGGAGERAGCRVAAREVGDERPDGGVEGGLGGAAFGEAELLPEVADAGVEDLRERGGALLLRLQPVDVVERGVGVGLRQVGVEGGEVLALAEFDGYRGCSGCEGRIERLRASLVRHNGIADP